MAEGSRDQGGASAADLEDDSPNMMVYRKVSLAPSRGFELGRAGQRAAHGVVWRAARYLGGPGSILKSPSWVSSCLLEAPVSPPWVGLMTVLLFQREKWIFEHERSLLGSGPFFYFHGSTSFIFMVVRLD